MKILNKKVIGACIITAAAVFNASTVTAGVILFNGGLFEVSVDNISQKTADFVYTADFTNWNTQWDRDYVTAVDFKLSGYTVKNVTNTSTTATPQAEWAFGSAQNSNATGCKFSDGKTFACAGNQPFVEATATAAAGILTWNFTVEFNKDIVAADLVAENTNHIGAFFVRCRDSDGKCNSGNGLSTYTTFNPPGGGGPPVEVPVPVPGTVLLLGLGLLGLRFRPRA